MRVKYIKPALSVFVLYILTGLEVAAQQTVGIFKNTPQALKGYVLMAPLGDSVTYLLNNCGEVVHRWVSNYRPGLSCYLLEDGTLVRPFQVPNATFNGQGGGGVQKLDWNSNVLWSYRYTSPLYHQHHDISPMPNGNVLLLAFEYKTQAEALAAGRKFNSAIWPEHIVEIEPVGTDSGKVVWEWHAWDHAIQEFDSNKSNYGVVAQHPELLHLNYPPSGGNGNNPADWMHGNGLDYNPQLDQIILSARAFSEFYIIDHSTTTSQAASHSGGRYGKGGDILYRWGNPAAYNRGDSSTKQLFYQHNVNWIKNGLPGAGNIIAFNNGPRNGNLPFSTITEIQAVTDSVGFYTQPGASAFGPSNPLWTYQDSPADSFYSAFIGGAQRLINGNTLVCEGTSGHLFEVDSAGNTMWSYVNPSSNSGIISQGTVPTNNFVFRAYKYPANYSAFAGKTLNPQGYLEKNAWNYNCSLFDSLATEAIEIEPSAQIIYPNPANSRITIQTGNSGSVSVCIFNLLGKEVLNKEFIDGSNFSIDIKDWTAGIYTVELRSRAHSQLNIFRFIKE
ncbi:MAG TPA: aryl-sulfate sulfotransferase [Bacteroidia bacterium]|nr:aryl-sulfate sulfotransferase [Bacteroidia bacterium]